MRLSRVERGSGVLYIFVKEGSCWVVEYERDCSVEGNESKVSDAMNCGY